jgi:hypothetical protein
METPNKFEPVLAKIQQVNDLVLSHWYEVVCYEDEWCSYGNSVTFTDGETVVNWIYCEYCF